MDMFKRQFSLIKELLPKYLYTNWTPKYIWHQCYNLYPIYITRLKLDYISLKNREGVCTLKKFDNILNIG